MAYINYNSTNAPRSQQLNISDIGYDQVLTTRKGISNFINNVKKFVNAPPYADVIINSGATESIANVLLWAKLSNPFGEVYGTDLDHESVYENCKNLDMKYNLLDKSFPTNASIVFLTHVSGKTGEILDIQNFMRNVKQISFLNLEDNSKDININEINTRQYKPLIISDVSQSIGKLPIDMQNNNLDAVFWSMHKLGGPQGYGVLVINNHNQKHPFKPLIAGFQQGGLRGGTLPLSNVIGLESLFKTHKHNTIQLWKDAVKYFEEFGLNVIKPKRNHLHNTILIKINYCPLQVINMLSKENIFIGAVSACSLEKYIQNNTINENLDQDENAYIRISFGDGKEFTKVIMRKIAKTIINYEKELQQKERLDKDIAEQFDFGLSSTINEDIQEMIDLNSDNELENELDSRLAFM